MYVSTMSVLSSALSPRQIPCLFINMLGNKALSDLDMECFQSLKHGILNFLNKKFYRTYSPFCSNHRKKCGIKPFKVLLYIEAFLLKCIINTLLQ